MIPYSTHLKPSHLLILVIALLAQVQTVAISALLQYYLHAARLDLGASITVNDVGHGVVAVVIRQMYHM